MKSHKNKKAVLIVIDAIIFYASLVLALFLRYGGLDEVSLTEHIIAFTIIFPFWVFFFGAFGLYDLRLAKNKKYFFYKIIQAFLSGTLAAIVIFYLLPMLSIEPRRNLFLIITVSIILISIWRTAFNFFVVKAGQSSKILFLGISNETLEIVEFLKNNPQLGQNPVALAGDSPNNSLDGLEIFNFNSDDISKIINSYGINTIVISPNLKENKTLIKTIFQALPMGINIIEFTSFYETMTGKIPLTLIEEIWFLENIAGGEKRTYQFLKRGVDIFLSILAGIPALLLTPFIVLAIKIDSRGAALFKQKRVGLNGRTFILHKFRSMIEGADKMGGLKGNDGDERNTRVGIFLRKTYLDELPQIINVLKGEMSFIGPRPERPEFVDELAQRTPFYKMRLIAPPGLTGWAQINMENDASVEDAPEKVQYDLYYIKNRSFLLDIIIVIRTLLTVSRREGR